MRLIGFHATRSGHRASLKGGLRVVPGVWDHASGGELGNGFYVIKTFKKTPAVYAYGYGIAAAVVPAEGVDIWSVYCSKELAEMDSFAVPVAQQWLNIPASYCNDYDWLSNFSENPAVQIKFNPKAYSYLTIELTQVLTLQEADNIVFGPS
ncbi:hypothetical protein RHM58_23055 [Pseudomonas sp. 10S4]|uniref:hypothetical protein n=1 Tax=Pseudomonas sp. 10S4 TaxID=3048583 RepID=UPI002AC9E62C|nr:MULTISPECIES: hypothetical protein [unclassified Pseudomonas]MEB0226113.1 hypothetical protein [Pseudomonas sp. 5S1]WPX16840.1 hypothetical protein RHM58_23055 [Pseudomonas sp. 10S4]